ncbi:uncharacterized protein FPOAC1_013010 [Fusarium poae]|uniref:uncharacterized protein n=1 Tax=Fusarium poae TaxID=36050 RepID=UPI001D046DF6|nr:uncharacterized protein FPOAC1_013010 [Fusarium poae]KAG8665032.1 hypothetical protein FPOAC1_013010 [Fusarium poae]
MYGLRPDTIGPNSKLPPSVFARVQEYLQKQLQNDEYHRALSEFTHFRMRTGGPEDLYLELFVNAQGKKVWMDGAVASTNGDFEWEGVLQWTGDILRVGTEVPSVVED